MWVMPSSSARCAQLPRASDKVPFYSALKKFRDYLNGLIPEIDESDIVFCNSKLKNYKEDSRDDLDGDITVKKEDDEEPSLKKKRGRPKKNKLDGEEVKREPKDKIPSLFDEDPSKKKRGRPKKVKGDPNSTTFNHSDLDIKPEKSNSSEISSLPSMYNMMGARCNGFVSSPVVYNRSDTISPGDSRSHSTDHLSHSDVKDNTPLYESNTFTEDTSTSPKTEYPPSSMKEEPNAQSNECCFPSAKDENPPTGFLEYDSFTMDPDSNSRYLSPKPQQQHQHLQHQQQQQEQQQHHHQQHQQEQQNHQQEQHHQQHPQSTEYQVKPHGTPNSSDMTSKSLSRLESLVDQIPNLTETDISPLSTVVTEQYSEDSAYLSDYPRTYSAQSLAVSEYQPYSNPLTNDYNTNHSSSQSPTNLNLQEKSFMPTYHDTSSYPNVMRPTPSHPYLVNSYNNFRIGPGEPDPSSYSYPGSYPNPHPAPGYNFHLTGPNFLYSPYPNNSYIQHPTGASFIPDVFKTDM